ncbi:MAG TPA: DinB family protein [Thermoanaerobaculia bacterium]|nr:DinB family protein [Thermoanaerobaculia bacterium]
MKPIVVCRIAFFLFGAVAATAAAQQKPAPTLRAALLEQLKMTHTEQDWYVPASKAVVGLTFEQAIWKPGKDDHSIAQLVHHLAFWNGRALVQLQGGKPGAFSGNNEETFEPPKDKAGWDALVKEMDDVMTRWEKAVETADDSKLAGWQSTIAHVATHNAYHTGQMLYVRKLQGSWDPSKGVK